MKLVVFFLASLFLVNAFQSHNLRDAEAAVRKIYEGMFQEAGVDRPDVIYHCYNDESSQLMVNFLNTVFKQMAANNVIGVKKTVAVFKTKVDKNLRQCLLDEPKVKEVNTVLFAWAEATLDYIVDRTIAYAANPLTQASFHEKAVDCNNNFQAGNYKEFGIKASAAAKTIFKKFPSISLTDREALQQMFNGGFDVVSLAHPTTLVSCFDDDSASLAIKTVGTVLDSLVTYDVITAEQTIFDFNRQLPQPVKDCLNKNEEYQAGLKAYHIADLTPKQREAKIMKYLRTHIFKLHSTVVDADNKFKNGAFTDVGHIFGVVLKDIFNSKLVGLTDSQIVQELYNGIFEKVDLPHPTTVVSCFDDPSASLTVKYLGVVLQQLASSNLVAAERSAHEYTSQLPAAVLSCLDKNEEIQAARVKYNIVGLTFDQIQAKVKKYSLTHIFQLYIDAVKANNNFLAGNYNQVGQQGGALAQAIFKSGKYQLSSDRDSLQQMFNGVFETGKLSHPTTVVPCFDDASATLTVEAVGNILHQAAKNNFSAAQQIATAFIAKLPQPVKDCLSNNQELAQLEHAYHLDTLTPTQIQQKITTYVTTHLIQVHKDLVEADNNFQGGKFFQVGQKAGEVCQNIFGKVAFVRAFLG